MFREYHVNPDHEWARARWTLFAIACAIAVVLVVIHTLAA
jgi:hypothetical protein